MNWIQRNFKTLIYIAFLVPILTVAFVSISHVAKWYGISNPISWAIYLSVGIEIAALSALAAISANMGKKVYFPFGIVTLIQFIGNVYFAYQYIDVNTQSFKDWVSLVDPLVSFFVEEGDFQGHKRFLAFFAGGMLPLISLSFLHMLVKFEEESKKKIDNKDTESIEVKLPTIEVDEKIEQDLKFVTEKIEKKEPQNDFEQVKIKEVEEKPDQVEFEEKNHHEKSSEDQNTDQTEEITKRKTLTYTK